MPCRVGGESEMFELFPKEYLVGLISHIYEDQERHFLFCDENFPRLTKECFWSIGYHYIFLEEAEIDSLIELLHSMRPDKDWKIIHGLSERVGKGKRGEY